MNIYTFLKNVIFYIFYMALPLTLIVEVHLITIFYLCKILTSAIGLFLLDFTFFNNVNLS